MDNNNLNPSASGNNNASTPDQTLANTNSKIDAIVNTIENEEAESGKIYAQVREAAGISGNPSPEAPATGQTFATADKIPVNTVPATDDAAQEPMDYTDDDGENKSNTAKIVIIILTILAVGLAAGLVYSLVKLNKAETKIKKQANKIEKFENYSALQTYAVLAYDTELRHSQNVNSKYKAAVNYLNEKNKASEATAVTEKEKAKAAEKALEAQPGSVSPTISAAAALSTKKIAAFSGADTGTLTKKMPIVLYRGHLETYYSSKNYKHKLISKMKLDANGVYRDANGFVCVAASSRQLKAGSYVNTSHGVGRVYDYGAASGTLSLYTNW